MIDIHGGVAEGFGPVADAFERNFAAGTEIGAACAVYHQGRLVVDLHGGVADPRTGRPWGPDTLAVGYSVSKGLMALCAYVAHQRGLFDFDDPVTAVWPEFGANGKDTILIRDLFSHRAGLAALDADLDLDDLARWAPVVRAIEEQTPLWSPGTAFAYHALTFGWLTGEVLRRVTGHFPRELFADYFTTPLEAEAWIGLPATEEYRVARHTRPVPTQLPVSTVEPTTVAVRSVTLGGALPFTLIDGGDHDFNAPAVHALQIPAGGAITNARSLARIYASAVSTIEGRPPRLSSASIADATTVRSSGSAWADVPAPPGVRFSTGFLINGIPYLPLLSDRSFGHDGASGSLGFADADSGVGFGYVNNRFADAGDERANHLVAALRGCLCL